MRKFLLAIALVLNILVEGECSYTMLVEFTVSLPKPHSKIGTGQKNSSKKHEVYVNVSITQENTQEPPTITTANFYVPIDPKSIKNHDYFCIFFWFDPTVLKELDSRELRKNYCVKMNDQVSGNLLDKTILRQVEMNSVKQLGITINREFPRSECKVLSTTTTNDVSVKDKGKCYYFPKNYGEIESTFSVSGVSDTNFSYADLKLSEDFDLKNANKYLELVGKKPSGRGEYKLSKRYNCFDLTIMGTEDSNHII